MIDLNKKLQRLLFTRAEQQAFLEDVCSLVVDGVPAPQAIATVHEIAANPTKTVARDILQAISEGQRIADGMAYWFPQSVVEIVRAGEEGGMLIQTMQAAAKSLSKQASALTSLLTSITYPLVVLLMAMAVSVFLKHSIFQTFATIKAPTGWPVQGRALLVFASFIENWWWLIAIMLIAFGFFIRKVLTNLTGEPRKLIDSLPLFSLYRQYASARFMETLGLLLNNGISMKQALVLMQRNAAPYLAWHIYMMQFRLSTGSDNIADVLNSGMVSFDNILRLRVMAKGKGFEQALLNLGKQALERTTKTIKITGRISGGLLLALDASIAIFMIFAIYNVGAYIGT